MVENMEGSTADALGLSRAILVNGMLNYVVCLHSNCLSFSVVKIIFIKNDYCDGRIKFYKFATFIIDQS